MNRLNILELHKTIQEKRQKKQECFDRVLGTCHNRIRAAAEIQQFKTIIVVPEFVVGYPIFNINECLEYIIDALRKNGFLVRYYFPKILYVSWDFDEIKSEKKPPPAQIVQKPRALLASTLTTNRNGRFQLNL